MNLVLPKCDRDVDELLASRLFEVGKLWLESPLRPQPSVGVVHQWTELIDEWVATSRLPLLVRKTVRGIDKGAVVWHQSGRKLVFCDNSPAQWVFTKAMRGECPSLGEVVQLIEADQIPICMIERKIPTGKPEFRCALSKLPHSSVNEMGWKLAHVESVGLGARTPLHTLQIQKIFDHFRRLMLPSNMFLVPLSSAGFAETEGALRAFRCHREAQRAQCG